MTAAFLELAPTSLDPELRTLFELRIGPAVAVFFLLSAVAHTAVASKGLRTWYERNLARELNPARWIEYSVSASVMIVVIAMLVGVYFVYGIYASIFVLFNAFPVNMALQYRGRGRWSE